MKSEDKLNLTKVYITGKLLNGKKTDIGLSKIYKTARDIPFLAKYYNKSDKELRTTFIENVSRDILTNVNDPQGNRVFFTSPENQNKYISFEEKYGEDYRHELFARYINQALRHSDGRVKQ